MASASSAIREKSVAYKPLIGVLLTVTLGFIAIFCSSKADAGSYPQAGLVTTSPQWGLGIQLGNYNATGFSVERVGILDGGLNLTLALGLANSSFGVAADYIRYFGSGFRPLSLNDRDSYDKIRDQLTPYLGLGLQMDNGLGIRIPAGIQYTLARQPVTLFGGFALYLGPFFSSRSLGPELWFSIGARLLM